MFCEVYVYKMCYFFFFQLLNDKKFENIVWNLMNCLKIDNIIVLMGEIIYIRINMILLFNLIFILNYGKVFIYFF